MTKLKVLFFSIFIFACSSSVFAEPPATLKGEIVQGRVVLGKTEHGNIVTLDDKELMLSPDGNFVFAFGRDDEKTHILRIKSVDGSKSFSKKLVLKKGNWPVQKINGLPERKVTPSAEDNKEIEHELSVIAEQRKIISSDDFYKNGFIMPAKGEISGVFGAQRILNGEPKSPHSGTDIAATTGAEVVAPCDGTVSLVEKKLFYTGNVIMIDHGQGLQTIYAHLSKIDVTKGQKVKKGQKIGEVGATGRATGPHLHWGASWFETKVNPLSLVIKM